MDDAVRPEYHKDDVVRNLWQAYKKTNEYKSGRTESISSVHPLIRKREAEALNAIFKAFVIRLQSSVILRERYQSKTVGEWTDDWKRMHATLFHNVLRERGELRQTEVRFGSPGDEERHRIPNHLQMPAELQQFAYQISKDLVEVVSGDIDNICEYLARAHYQFIRIHPFNDGNGRIARVLTDQLAICLGLPPVVTGFPRTDPHKKRVYHDAITECTYDPACTSLKRWIKSQITYKITEIA
jgi:Fic family protein